MLNDIAAEIHANAETHGWWEGDRQMPELIALCHSELSEALEADRAGDPLTYYEIPLESGETQRIIGIDDSGAYKMEGAATELIDCVIRIFDMLAHYKVDITRVLLAKMRYNRNRPYKHGKRY